MARRTRIALLVWSLVAAACSSSHMGPTLPKCSSSTATTVTLSVAGYIAIDPSTDAGCVAFPANASAIDSAEYLVVPQSAAGTFQDSAAFQLGSATLAAARLPSLQRLYAPGPRAARRQIPTQFDGLLRRLGRTHGSGPAPLTPTAPRAATLAPPATITPPTLGSQHTFVVCANLNCTTTKQVTGKVTTLGKRIAIYVDTLAPSPGLDTATLDTLQQAFDARLFPLDSTNFGPVSDIDSNGVVIVLMTGVVNALVSRNVCETQGFVAGFFYPPDLDPTNPQPNNRGEIFYSIVADPDSTLSCPHTAAQLKRDLGGTFIHELQHMINYNGHVLVHKDQVGEEGWLDEGLSKYAEELAGRSYLAGGTHQDSVTFSDYVINDVFDAYQYLSRPDTAYLLIPFDQGNLAEIGASWLFLRYLVDQFGVGVTPKLVQTGLTGSTNVATQTGQPFTTTVTRWALANWVSDLPGFITPSELSYPSWHFRTRTFPSLHNVDPGDFPLPFPLVPPATAGSAVSLSGLLRSGSGAYARVLQGPNATAFALLFSGGNGTPVSSVVTPRLNVIRIR